MNNCSNKRMIWKDLHFLQDNFTNNIHYKSYKNPSACKKHTGGRINPLFNHNIDYIEVVHVRQNEKWLFLLRSLNHNIDYIQVVHVRQNEK